MTLSRARALALLSSTVVLAHCARRSAIAVGSKNFTESIVIGEIYAQTLERAGFSVERRLNLGSTQIALAAMARGDIDLYPEYTGTALIDVLHHAPLGDSREIYRIVRDEFSKRYGLDWLDPSPMNDSQGIATTRAIAVRFGLRTLSDLSRVSSKLRLATIPEFITRADGLPGLRRRYGGFTFASVRTYDIALKYQALLTGSADVATAFTTDGTIATQRLVLLDDNKHLWPPYNVAPLVRHAALAKEPRIATVLNAIAPKLNSERVQEMNAAVEDGNREPADVAADFLKAET
ncbi:MAG: glycine betaine ABC transporter substrate-binding protein [Candidatus Baltobacteraceae bacterium]